MLEARPAWEDNTSHAAFLAFTWSGPGDLHRLVVVNYAPHRSQSYLPLPWGELPGQTWRLQDRLGEAIYERNGDDLSAQRAAQGLYLDMPAWGFHVFDVNPF